MKSRNLTFGASWFIIICLLVSGFQSEILAFGKTGWYATRVKFEYQYSDYNEYRYPLSLSSDPEIGYEYLNPYVTDFPEHRILTKVQQTLGPKQSIELRHEYSNLSDYKDQHRAYLRYNRYLSDTMTLYGSLQNLNIGINNPDSSANVGGNVATAGLKYDRSGWIKGEAAVSYDMSRDSNGLIINTLKPMLNVRWSLNSFTALSGRIELYRTTSDSGVYIGRAFSVVLSRYLPTQTALHAGLRVYNHDYGVKSISPTFEIGQYLRWDLSMRLRYRYFACRFDEDAIPDFIKGRSINSHSYAAEINWQVRSDVQTRFKYRRYISDQDIKMNTYLLSFEFDV